MQLAPTLQTGLGIPGAGLPTRPPCREPALPGPWVVTPELPSQIRPPVDAGRDLPGCAVARALALTRGCAPAAEAALRPCQGPVQRKVPKASRDVFAPESTLLQK